MNGLTLLGLLAQSTVCFTLGYLICSARRERSDFEEVKRRDERWDRDHRIAAHSGLTLDTSQPVATVSELPTEPATPPPTAGRTT